MVRRPKWIFVLVMLALAALACNVPGLTPQEAVDDSPPPPAVPSVDIRVPVNGMSYAEGTNVIIQVVGSDAGAGISRIDLLVDDVAAGSSTAPNAAGQAAFLETFEWLAQGQGLHSISAVAYRQDGTASEPAMTSINVVGAAPTRQPTTAPATAVPTEEPSQTQPTEEEATEAPQPTATSNKPRGVTTAGLNVRSGPTTFHPILGALLGGTEVDLLARNADSSWFIVPYGLSQGWVSGFYLTISGDVNSLEVRTAPPPPPTSTPIPTAIPVTAAPTVPAGPSISFTSTVGDGSYPSGTCFTFWWEVTGIKAVYFNGEGVTGSGSREVCPTATTTYTLRVVKPDDSVDERSITANIN